MSSQNKPLTLSFERIEREIIWLKIFLYLCFVLIIFRILYLLFNQLYLDASSTGGHLIILLSALLVANAAERQIVHSSLIRVDEKVIDILRISHHLLSITQDIRNRIHFIKTSIEGRPVPLVAIVENIRVIEKRFESFYEKDIYVYLQPEVVEKIHSLSATVFGLSSTSKTLELMYEANHALLSINVPLPTSESIISGLASSLEDLGLIETQIRQLRATID